MQAHARRRAELQVIDAEISHFLHAAAGVVQREQESTIAEGEAALGRQLTEERRNRILIEKARFGRWDAFAGNGGDLLCDGEILRDPPSQRLEECVQDH
jgi:hypothetical protein